MKTHYHCLGPPRSDVPVIISVPHAGREYPSDMIKLARLSPQQLRPLEDRFADRLADVAISHGISAIVATAPRAWIDLNRSEREYDPAFVDGAQQAPPLASAKVRGGLGIIPKYIFRDGNIWHGRVNSDTYEARLALYHRPYHQALAAMIDKTVERFGTAIVIDLHSMPPLPTASEKPTPQLIIGDLFGRSAANRFCYIAARVAANSGLDVAANVPYAGGHILETHGDPARGVHALQIEIDRSRYLDKNFDQPSSGLADMQQLVWKIAKALGDEASALPHPQGDRAPAVSYPQAAE